MVVSLEQVDEMFTNNSWTYTVPTNIRRPMSSLVLVLPGRGVSVYLSRHVSLVHRKAHHH